MRDFAAHCVRRRPRCNLSANHNNDQVKQCDDDVCLASSADVTEYFAAVSSPPRMPFNFDHARDRKFREAINALPQATLALDAFAAAPSFDEIEDQLGLVRATSASGHDGVGYDLLKRFAQQLLPLLHAAYACCWCRGRVPALRKVRHARLVLKKKSERARVVSWRPIALLAKCLSRRAEANKRLPAAQKGYRELRGRQEHNVLASSLLAQARHMRLALNVVWQNVETSFSTVPHQLMWAMLRCLGVDECFVVCSAYVFSSSCFVVGNSAEGATGVIDQL